MTPVETKICASNFIEQCISNLHQINIVILESRPGIKVNNIYKNEIIEEITQHRLEERFQKGTIKEVKGWRKLIDNIKTTIEKQGKWNHAILKTNVRVGAGQ